MMSIHVIGKYCLLSLLLTVPGVTGCRLLPDRGAFSYPADQVVYRGFSGPPRIRFGSYPSSNLGTFFKGPDLGAHGYTFRLAEKNGVVYTCRGGHLDIIHVRITADWTAYLIARTYEHLMNHDTEFSYKLAVDRSRNFIRLTYPENWDALPKVAQRAIAREIAFALGPYLAFTMTTWHEMLTWYGFKCVGPFPEYPSAFSWEDSYSNLVGTIVGVRALQDAQHPYNQAVKIALSDQMQKLGVQPARVARTASESVRGQWFTGHIIFQVNMKKRNFDIGLDDGYITPTLVPEFSACPDAEPLSYPVPNLNMLAKHGFHAVVEIEPHEWERGKLLHAAYGGKPRKRIRPEEHFPLILNQIRREAALRYGPEYSPDRDRVPQTIYTAH